MPVAQGISMQLKRVKQSALGSPGSSGSKLMRRVSFGLNKEGETYTSNEIVSHQQSTGATEGPSMENGPYNTELSPGSYDLEFASLLRRDYDVPFAAITGVALTIAGSGPTFTITRGSGSWLTDGVKVGMVVRLSVGSLNAANSGKNLLVAAIGSATVMTVVPLNGVAMVAEGPISGCTISAPGKATYAPTTGHTNDYFTWEKWYSDISRSELFTDVKPASAALSIPASGIATCNFTLTGLARSAGGAEVLTSPAAASTSAVMAAVQGKVVVNGQVTAVTGAQVQINGNISGGEPEVGSNSRSDLQRGRIAVSGQFMAKFTSGTLQSLRDSQAVVTLILALADSALGTAEFFVITMPAIKIFSDAADDGDKEVIRTYDFTAQYNGAGGAGQSTHQTICQIQDSLAA